MASITNSTGLTAPGIPSESTGKVASTGIKAGAGITSAATDPNFTLSQSALGPWKDEATFKYAVANDAAANAEAFGNQQLSLYEQGKLPTGTQAAIDLAQKTSLGGLSGQLAAQGLDPATSTQFTQGAATIATEKSIQTQQALQQVLQNYFQAQGIALQADQLIGQFNEFDQELQLQYFQIAVQQKEFAQQQKKAAMGQAGGALGGLFSAGGGGGKAILMASMAALHQLMGMV